MASLEASPSLCFESQSAAVVTLESNESLFIIIKWIDQRSLHVQKCNDIANEIVPLLPSQRSNYTVKGHGGLTEMGRFSMTHSWICLSYCMRILHHQIFFVALLRRTLPSSFPSFISSVQTHLRMKAEIEQLGFVQYESCSGYRQVYMLMWFHFELICPNWQKMDTICCFYWVNGGNCQKTNKHVH